MTLLFFANAQIFSRHIGSCKYIFLWSHVLGGTTLRGSCGKSKVWDLSGFAFWPPGFVCAGPHRCAGRLRKLNRSVRIRWLMLSESLLVQRAASVFGAIYMRFPWHVSVWDFRNILKYGTSFCVRLLLARSLPRGRRSAVCTLCKRWQAWVDMRGGFGSHFSWQAQFLVNLGCVLKALNLQPLYTEKHKVSCSGFLPKT